MKETHPNLSEKQLDFIHAYAKTQNDTRAAEVADIDRETARRWRKDPVIAAEIERAARVLYDSKVLAFEEETIKRELFQADQADEQRRILTASLVGLEELAEVTEDEELKAKIWMKLLDFTKEHVLQTPEMAAMAEMGKRFQEIEAKLSKYEQSF